jgi:hypothetical protein
MNSVILCSKHLAFTYLAAPSSTATNERLFSMAGNVVNEERPRTQAQLAQAVQCLRSWEGLKKDLTTPTTSSPRRDLTVAAVAMTTTTSSPSAAALIWRDLTTSTTSSLYGSTDLTTPTTSPPRAHGIPTIRRSRRASTKAWITTGSLRGEDHCKSWYKRCLGGSKTWYTTTSRALLEASIWTSDLVDLA